jgi:hypothetical protein
MTTPDQHTAIDDNVPPTEPARTAATDITAPFVERRVNQQDRRRFSLRSLWRGGWVPRRRAGRRASDQYVPIDWHDPHLLFLAVAMLVLSVTDAFMTVTLLANGAIESNPLLAFVLNEHPKLFAAVKMTLTGCGVLVLVALARTRLLGLVSARRLFQGAVLAYLALVGYELWLVSLMG